MKLLPVVFLMLFPGFSYSEEIKLRFFNNEELPRGQSGCWYYQPPEEKQRGKILAVVESADEAIYFIINGKKTGIGNWRYDHQEKYHLTSYSNEVYSVSIHSIILSDSRYSSEFESKITISTKDNSHTLEAFGECGS